MTPQELKNSILQLAIQGKLVEQRAEEGTGEELYQQIQEEKQRMIKAGSLKKEKPLPEVSETEVPFDVPENWIWTRLGNIASVLGGKRIPAGRTLTTENTGYTYIRVSDMKNGSVLAENLMYVPKDIYPSISRYIIHKEDIYITVAGTIGRVGKIPPEIDGANLTENADRLVFQILDQDWLIKCLESSLIQQQIIDATTKVGQPKLAIKRIQELFLPIPPLAEQKRIVAKIEELLPYIDRYENAWSKLEDFNKRFPVDMQKSILQMAIQGKLVEQRPEEGTGEDLYRQIQAEKQALIKSGAIKKEKPLPEITEDELPFDIPENWKWAKLNEVSKKITDGEHKTPRRIDSYDGYYLLSARNVRDGFVLLDNVDYVDREEYEKISTRCNPQRNDILISCSGSVGRCAVIEDDNKYVMVRSAAMISPIFINSKYLMYAIQSETVQEQIRSKTKQTAQANLFQEAIRNLIIPLPPLAEQKRIVSKLEEILPLCERLK
ncbi:MAG: restriction endonuclease subunit S [Clostridia bacterium]|nr:restriction endonuclease subunit S [Clostridia bacterium]